MKLLAGISPTGGKRLTGNLVVVVGVHGLTELNHYKVGYIDYIADGADSCPFETGTHPSRRGTNLYILQHSD